MVLKRKWETILGRFFEVVLRKWAGMNGMVLHDLALWIFVLENI